MSSIRTKFLTALAAIGLVVGTALSVGTAPAFAASANSVCENGSGNGTLLCLNDWSGSGVAKMYTSGSSNENFSVELIGRCNGSDVVTTGCSSLSSLIDNAYNITGVTVQIVYNPTGQCVALNADLSTCNNLSTGVGGATGTVFVLPDVADGTAQLINNYYTGVLGSLVGLYGENEAGGTVYLGTANSSSWQYGTLN